MLPADVEIVEAAPVEIAPPRTQRTWTRHLKWLLVLIPLVLLVWWMGQDSSGKLISHERSTGEIGVLENDQGGPVVVAMDPDSANVLEKVGDIAEASELAFLIEQGRAVEIARGTTVRVLATASRGQIAHVRVISGPWESRKVWVPTRWVR